MPVPPDELWAWHARPGALERLTPPWERVRVVARTGGLEDGTRIALVVPVGPLRLTWVSRHHHVTPGRYFVDEQIQGPFVRWVHTHVMLPDGPSASILEDRIEYAAPGGPVGRALAGWLVPGRLEAMFRYRHDTLRADLIEHARYADRPRLTVAMTGSGGMLGTALRHFLTTGGHRVIRLVRRPSTDPDTALWDPERGLIEPERLPAIDAVIHLAGASIAGGRWNEARKAAIARSRSVGTRSLAESIARLPVRPAAFLAASAVGFYGSRVDPVTEQDGAGTGFLADVCREWEAATEPAKAAGIRVAHLRIGPVLSAAGGLLRLLLPLFRAGLGGRVGHGRQAFSWIGLDDVVGAVHHVLQNDIAGPVNVTAPHPVTNAEFSRELARVLGRPAILPAPASALRLVLGREMAEEVVLGGVRALPARLLESGYTFRHPHLETVLRHTLGIFR